MAKEVGEEVGEKIASFNLGNAYLSLGDYRGAIEYYEHGLKIAKEVGDRAGEGRSYGNFGNAYLSLGDFRGAIEYFEHGLKIAKEVGDRALEGKCYGGLGSAYRSLGDFTGAIEYHDHDLKIAKEVGDRAGEGMSYGNLGNAYVSLGDFRGAIEYFEHGLKIAKEVGDRALEGKCYNGLGNAYLSLGDFTRAIEYYEHGLKIAKEVGDRALEGKCYNGLGNAYLSLGDFTGAIEYFEHGLRIVKEVGDRAGEGKSYCNLGNACLNFGDFRGAIEYFEHGLKIAKQVGDRAGEGECYGSLGNAYRSLGDFRGAIEYCEHALKIAKEVGNRPGEGRSYCNLGSAYLRLGDFRGAIEYYEHALKIAKDVGNRAGEGECYGGLGNAYGRVLGEFRGAIEYYEHALKIAKEVGDRALEGKSYCNFGSAYLSLGDFRGAIEYYEHALKIAKEVGDRAGEGECYGGLGNAYLSLGDFTGAIEYYERALKIAKEVGDRAGEGKSYGNLGNAYKKLRDLRRAMEYAERAFKISQEVEDKVGTALDWANLGAIWASKGSFLRARDYCQNSVKILNEIRTNLQSKEEWKISFRDAHTEAYNRLWRVLFEQGEVVEALLAVEEGRAQALRDLMELKYGSEEENDPSHFADKSSCLMLSCPSSNIVFTAASDKGIVSWVIQNGKDIKSRGIKINKFISNKEVTVLIESLNQSALNELGTRTGVICEDRSFDKPCDENLPNERNTVNVLIPVPFQGSALRNLYDVIIAPIVDLVNGEELIFAPEGPLCLVPYAALMDSESKYLCESFRIRVIPSLTTLKLITDCPAEFHNKAGALLVGDPCLEEVRYKGRSLVELPYARKEAEMIGRILGTAPIIGKEATKAEVLKRLSSVALVHIAAHSRMGTGEIFLAPNPTRAAHPPEEEDYLLTMRDVSQAEIRARLVVLSCSHSAAGEVKAEGVVGIARAFLGAGARSVLVSLWALDDEGAMEFMKYFYRELINGISASEALKRAMGCMRESKQYSAAKYWAPFVLIGDDVTLELTGSLPSFNVSRLLSLMILTMQNEIKPLLVIGLFSFNGTPLKVFYCVFVFQILSNLKCG